MSWYIVRVRYLCVGNLFSQIQLNLCWFYCFHSGRSECICFGVFVILPLICYLSWDTKLRMHNRNEVALERCKVRQKSAARLRQNLVFLFTVNLLITFKTIVSHKLLFRKSHWRCSVKKVFLEISQNSQDNTCVKVSLLMKLKASDLQLYLKKRLWRRCFPVNVAKFLRAPFLQEHLLATASVLF